METETLRLLVKEIWQKNQVSNNTSTMANLFGNLMELKKEVVVQETKRKVEQRKEHAEIDFEYVHLSHTFSLSFSVETTQKMCSLEARKSQIVKMEEEVWRLKGRANWENKGDSNTKFFHSYKNHRRNINAI